MAKKKRKIMPIDLEEMVTLPEAAKLLDVDQTYVRLLVKQGRIAGFKFGRNYLVNRQSAVSFQKKPGYGRPKSKR
jgi:excisionase family DNA binding protein